MMCSDNALTVATRRVYSSYTRVNSSSRAVTYAGERSKVGGIAAFGDVGGRVILMKDGSRCDEYDSSAWTSSAMVSKVILMT